MSLSLDRLSSSLGLSSRSRSHSRTDSHPRSPSPHPNPGQTLTFRNSPQNDADTLIERCDPHNPYSTQPLFIFTSTSSKPNIKLSRLHLYHHQPPTLIGTATSHTTSGYISVTLLPSNLTMKLKPSSLSGKGHNFMYFGGKFVWKSDSLKGTALALRDQAGMTLALYKPEHGRLEVLVPCDDGFLDMVVLTALAAGFMEKKNGKVLDAVGEVFGELVGA